MYNITTTRIIKTLSVLEQNRRMCHFRNKKRINLPFRNDKDGDTPFQLVCHKYGKEEVKKVIESTLVADCSDYHYSTSRALISAAIDENISLDGVYFMLRREPDVLEKLLSSSSSAGPSDDSASENKQRRRRRQRWLGVIDNTQSSKAKAKAEEKN